MKSERHYQNQKLEMTMRHRVMLFGFYIKPRVSIKNERMERSTNTERLLYSQTAVAKCEVKQGVFKFGERFFEGTKK